MTYSEAKEKQFWLCKEQPRKLHFIMGKNNDFDVFSGFDGRDEGLKSGYVVPKYNMALSRYVTEWDSLDSKIID